MEQTNKYMYAAECTGMERYEKWDKLTVCLHGIQGCRKQISSGKANKKSWLLAAGAGRGGDGEYREALGSRGNLNYEKHTKFTSTYINTVHTIMTYTFKPPLPTNKSSTSSACQYAHALLRTFS